MTVNAMDNSCHIALKDFMGLKPEESLLVVSDCEKREIGLALFEQGKQLCKSAFYLEIKPMEINGQEPPEAIAELMKKVDVVVTPTSKSLTHTNARRNACAAGTRFGTMPGISKETLIRCFSADFTKILDTSAAVHDVLKNSSTVKVETSIGTYLEIPMKGREVYASTGVLRNPGDGGNLPSGEVFLAPWENKTNGILVVDGSIAGIGAISEPVTIEIVNGYATSFKGGKEAGQLQKMLDEVSPDARSVAEFGFGTNYMAKICGLILEDEKVLGTIHIAFGNNVSMGGCVNVPIHIDCIVKHPTVTFDNNVVMQNGKILL